MSVSYDLRHGAWMRHWGFIKYPFELYEAERELDQVPHVGPILSLFFVDQPYFYTVLGNPEMPQTAFLVARRGFGKTATRAMVDHKCRFGSYSGQVIVANYTDFGPLLEQVDYDLSRLTARDHVHMIVRAALVYLLDYVNPDHWALADRADRQLLATFAHTFADPATKFKLTRELTDSPVDLDWAGMSPAEILELFVQLILQTEHKAFYILIDCVDEFAQTAEDPYKAAEMLRSLIADQSLMNMPHVAFKFFLPRLVGDELERLVTIRHDRWSWEEIGWGREALDQLVRLRLRYHSQDQVMQFEDLCATDVRHMAMDRLILACRGSPRILLRLCDAVTQHRLSRGQSGHYIEFQDVDEVVSDLPPWATAAAVRPRARRSTGERADAPVKEGLWLDRGTVWVDGVYLDKQPSSQELKLLERLYESRGKVVDSEELIEAIWGRFATDQDATSLRKLVGRLRKRLDENKQRFIRNERGRGYRLEV